MMWNFTGAYEDRANQAYIKADRLIDSREPGVQINTFAVELN